MKRLLVLILIGMSLQLYSQTQGGENSPFSRFGIGDVITENPMYTRQMGGIGTSYIDITQLNFDNPATLGYMNQTAFDLGLDFKRSALSDSQRKSQQWSGNLSYITLGFPLRNPTNALFNREDYKFNWGMGFALMPNSTVSYDISRIDSSGTDLYNRSFEGTGGTYKAIWGNAIKVGDFSVGLNLGWLFGKVDYTRSIEFIDEVAAFNNDFSSTYSLNGFYSKLGLNYLYVMNKSEMLERPGSVAPNSISFGLSYKPALGFSTKAEVLNQNRLPFTLSTIEADTLFYSPLQEGSGSLPAELALGVTYSNGFKYGIGIDYRQTFWSNYRNDANPEELTNTSRIGIGGFFRPDYTSTAILPRSSYRFGLYYEESPQNIRDTQIKSFGLTAGIGLPLAWQRRFSHVNLGLDIGKRSVTNILSENFVKVTFGFTFNESDWFRRYYLD